MHVETSVVNVAELMSNSKEVLIVPGYGMAVSRAQGRVREIARICLDKGVTVKFGIHPVAGRMPGQMNVLLAEAGVPHEWVLEMNEVVSYVERQIFQLSITSSAGTMWDTAVNTATNDYDAIGPLPWTTGLPAPGYVPKTNPLNGRWVTASGGDAEFIKKSIASGMLGSAEASKIQASNYQSDVCSCSSGRAVMSLYVQGRIQRQVFFTLRRSGEGN